MPFNQKEYNHQHYLKNKERYHQYYLKNKEKYLVRSRKQSQKNQDEREKKCKEQFEVLETQERPLLLRPLLARCFRCKKWFLIKYVPWKKRFSLKNDWDYWTENKEAENKKICDICLKDLYRNHKKEYRQNIFSLDKRVVLRNYLIRMDH